MRGTQVYNISLSLRLSMQITLGQSHSIKTYKFFSSHLLNNHNKRLIIVVVDFDIVVVDISNNVECL